MRSYIHYFILGLLAFCQEVPAEIIETANFHEVEKHLTPDTLLILDIDDTLLIPTQTLGTDVWFRYRVKQNADKLKSFSQAMQKTISEWEAIRHITDIKIVEEGTDKIIERLQNKNVKMIGLTTQGLELATCTVNHLKSLNIDLLKTAPSDDHHYFTNDLGILYRHGILFTSGTQKGVALLKLLKQLDYHPKHIVFINDKATHIKEVEDIVEKEGIEFVGLRYSYCDERINSFRPEIADIQWKHSTFHTILSDNEAEQLLQNRK